MLQLDSGPEVGRRFEVKPGQSLQFGRGAKATARIAGDSMLSGVHFAIECSETECRLRDLGSRNGTRLNGQLVKEAQLRNGDYIAAGQSGFLVSFVYAMRPVAEAPAAAAPSPAAAPSSPPGAQPYSPPGFATGERGASALPFPPPPEPAPLAPGAPFPRIKPLHQEKWREPESAAAASQLAAQQELPPVNLLDFLRTEAQPLYAVLDAARDIRIIGLLREFGYQTPVPAISSGQREREIADMGGATAPPAGAPAQAEGPAAETAASPSAEPAAAPAAPPARPDRPPHAIVSLFNGYSALELEIVAPYLVRLPADSPLLEILAQEGWGQSWGIYLTSDKTMEEVRRHLRQFLIVEMPDGRKSYFRFYDPRVLRVFLPSCQPGEAREFLGPLAVVRAEAETGGSMHQYEWDARGEKLAAVSVALKDAAPMAAGA